MLEELFRQVNWFCPKDKSIMKPLGYTIGGDGDYLLITIYCPKCNKKVRLTWYLSSEVKIKRKDA